jgi:hypothetical protein
MTKETIAAQLHARLARRPGRRLFVEGDGNERPPSRFVYYGDEGGLARILLMNWDDLPVEWDVPHSGSPDARARQLLPVFDAKRAHELRVKQAEVAKDQWDEAVRQARIRREPRPPKPAEADDPEPFTAPLFKQPHLAAALALDLICASFPDSCYPPEAVVQLLVRVLGLPDNHKIGNWSSTDLDQRARGGRGRDNEARARAHRIDFDFYVENKRRMTPPEYKREFRRVVKDERLGFTTSDSSLQRWRLESFNKHEGDEDYLPPYPPAPRR